MKLQQEKHFYFDDNGFLVFTEQFHLKKGFCCGLGCRHCPYNYVNVPENERVRLLTNKQKDKELKQFVENKIFFEKP